MKKESIAQSSQASAGGEDFFSVRAAVFNVDGTVSLHSRKFGEPVDHDILGNPIYDPTEMAIKNAPVPITGINSTPDSRASIAPLPVSEPSAEQVQTTGEPVARVQSYISDRPYSVGKRVMEVVFLRDVDDDTLLYAVPQAVVAQPVDADRRDAEIERLNAIINTPQSDDFIRAVSIEAEHQRQRWGAKGDAGKTPADWFWLIGYLAGKALHSHAAGNVEKSEHHIITTAAACANWYLNMFGKTDMRPGIDPAQSPQAKAGDKHE